MKQSLKESPSYVPSFNLRRAHIRHAKLRRASGDPYILVTTPSFLKNCFETFFSDDSKREKFIKFNSSEQVKGQDCLNYQKARFYHLLFEAFGIEMVNHFVPYLQIFCSSTEECEQICASEIVAGLMRGKYLK